MSTADAGGMHGGAAATKPEMIVALIESQPVAIVGDASRAKVGLFQSHESR
jgi:hypothetical protein